MDAVTEEVKTEYAELLEKFLAHNKGDIGWFAPRLFSETVGISSEQALTILMHFYTEGIFCMEYDYTYRINLVDVIPIFKLVKEV